MTAPVPVDSISLENGLTLELLDASRPVAGDRWLVHLVALIRIPLNPDLLSGVLDGDRLFALLKERHGDSLEYRADLKRHFVGESDRDEIFSGLEEIVRREKLPYLSHPDFAVRFAVSQAREQRWVRW
jgi:hypothetical protein